MNKKYALHPDFVISTRDGDIHWIDASRLAELYGVLMRDCIVIDQRHPEKSRGYTNQSGESLIHLYPRNSGNYKIPTKEKP